MTEYYGDAAGFKAYWTTRGNAVLGTMDDADILVALLQASEWLDGSFHSQWPGIQPNGRDQIRDWPRSSVTDRNNWAVPSDVPPREVLNATYEAAAVQINSPGSFFKVYTPPKYTRVAVSGAVDVTYRTGNVYDFQTQIPAVANALAPILVNSGTGSGLSGATFRM